MVDCPEVFGLLLLDHGLQFGDHLVRVGEMQLHGLFLLGNGVPVFIDFFEKDCEILDESGLRHFNDGDQLKFLLDYNFGHIDRIYTVEQLYSSI